MRRNTPALLEGEYTPLHVEEIEYLAFLRQTPAQSVLCVFNYTGIAQQLSLDVSGYTKARLLFSSASRSKSEMLLAGLTVAPFEALIAELTP